MTGIFTLDSFMAVIIAFTMMTSSMFMLSQPRIDKKELLYGLSLDFLTVAEKNGALANAIDGDPGGVEELIARLPGNVCLDVRIKNESGALFYSEDTNCEQPEEYSLGKRSVSRGGEFYIATLRVWYR